LQFLGDVNLLQDGGTQAVYVRPHELDVLGAPALGAWPATLSQALAVGARTRIELQRDGDAALIDVELPRAEYSALRDKLALQRGSRVWLRARKVTRFEESAAA
jgi:sulfate/thiosulfate transport system ATP-binding protein